MNSIGTIYDMFCTGKDGRAKLAGLVPCLCVCAAAFIYALVQAIRTCNGQWEGISASMLLALAVVYFELKDLLTDETQAALPSGLEQGMGWALLLGAACIPFLFSDSTSELPHNIAIAFFAIAAILFFHGWKVALKLSPAMILFCVFIPLREQFVLMISYPLRLISTYLSVGLLKLFGANIQSNLTTIMLPGETHIVITDACSGIQQLEAMLLLAYIIIRMQPKPLVWSICHYLFLLPVVIVANAVRIIATILLYHAIGPQVLNNTWHTGLGYCLVLACSILIWSANSLFPNQEQNTDHKPDGAEASTDNPKSTP